jgi:lipooligosaccharide transport system ATP-binding protein
MDEASRLCDRLVIMDQGRILVEGRPLDLIKEHVGQDVIEVAGPDDALRTYIQSQPVVYEDLGHRMIIYGQESDRMFHTISEQYCKEGCILRMATLEDVFLKLTGRGLRE